jgi:hypothetical protein
MAFSQMSPWHRRFSMFRRQQTRTRHRFQPTLDSLATRIMPTILVDTLPPCYIREPITLAEMESPTPVQYDGDWIPTEPLPISCLD